MNIFQPVFDRIRQGAVEREETRQLPFEQVGRLRDAGFGRVRVPAEFGGFGATIDPLVLLLIGLGAANSNLPQALRGHVGFTEYVLAHADSAYREFWFAELAGGALVGNAESERTGTFGSQATEVSVKDGVLLLNGTKYYTTGSIFADWILVSASVRTTGSRHPSSPQRGPNRARPRGSLRGRWTTAISRRPTRTSTASSRR